MMQAIATTLVIVALVVSQSSHSFAFSTTTLGQTCIKSFTTISPTTTSLSMCPGGWGIGTPNEMQDGEFTSSSSNNQRRRRRKDSLSNPTQSEDYLEDVAYNTDVDESRRSYDFMDSTQFAEKVQFEKEQLKDRRWKDLMEVARMSGFGERVEPRANEADDGDGVVGERLGMFEDDILEEVGSDDSLDSLDVRVKFD